MMKACLKSEGLHPPLHGVPPPIRNLALGILVQALRDVVLEPNNGDREPIMWRRDALQWLSSNETGPGSLNWVCQILVMNPRKLQLWLQRTLQSKEEREQLKKLLSFQFRRLQLPRSG